MSFFANGKANETANKNKKITLKKNKHQDLFHNR